MTGKIESAEKPAEQKTSFVDVFMKGAQKGWSAGIKSMIPAVILAYMIIAVLDSSGILALLEKVFDPVMAVFGLPGAAIACIITGFMTRPGGMATAMALFSSGALTAHDVTILLVPIILLGGALGQYVRVVIVSGVEHRAHKFLWINHILIAFISIWVMQLLTKIMGI